MDTWEEQPIDDSKGVEQFKVGDTVRVWGNVHGEKDGRIQGHPPYVIEAFKNGDNIRIGENIYAHYKQCRLLKKKGPKVWWAYKVKEDSPWHLMDQKCEVPAHVVMKLIEYPDPDKVKEFR